MTDEPEELNIALVVSGWVYIISSLCIFVSSVILYILSVWGENIPFEFNTVGGFAENLSARLPLLAPYVDLCRKKNNHRNGYSEVDSFIVDYKSSLVEINEKSHGVREKTMKMLQWMYFLGIAVFFVAFVIRSVYICTLSSTDPFLAVSFFITLSLPLLCLSSVRKLVRNSASLNGNGTLDVGREEMEMIRRFELTSHLAFLFYVVLFVGFAVLSKVLLDAQMFLFVGGLIMGITATTLPHLTFGVVYYSICSLESLFVKKFRKRLEKETSDNYAPTAVETYFNLSSMIRATSNFFQKTLIVVAVCFVVSIFLLVLGFLLLEDTKIENSLDIFSLISFGALAAIPGLLWYVLIFSASSVYKRALHVVSAANGLRMRIICGDSRKTSMCRMDAVSSFQVAELSLQMYAMPLDTTFSWRVTSLIVTIAVVFAAKMISLST